MGGNIGLWTDSERCGCSHPHLLHPGRYRPHQLFQFNTLLSDCVVVCVCGCVLCVCVEFVLSSDVSLGLKHILSHWFLPFPPSPLFYLLDNDWNKTTNSNLRDNLHPYPSQIILTINQSNLLLDLLLPLIFLLSTSSIPHQPILPFPPFSLIRCSSHNMPHVFRRWPLSWEIPIRSLWGSVKPTRTSTHHQLHFGCWQVMKFISIISPLIFVNIHGIFSHVSMISLLRCVHCEWQMREYPPWILTLIKGILLSIGNFGIWWKTILITNSSMDLFNTVLTRILDDGLSSRRLLFTRRRMDVGLISRYKTTRHPMLCRTGCAGVCSDGCEINISFISSKIDPIPTLKEKKMVVWRPKSSYRMDILPLSAGKWNITTKWRETPMLHISY